jgi:hypothetical protein
MSLPDDFKKNMVERRRALILLFLSSQPNYLAGADDIEAFLKSRGKPVNRGQLIADLVALQNLDCLIVIAEGTAARVTGTGYQVAQGDIEMPGVAKPLPE